MESILDAAERVIAEVGYEGASTNLIAREAGISPGSLYQYFANKADIAAALTGRYLPRLAEALGGLDDPDLARAPVEDLIARAVDPVVALNVGHPAAKALLTASDPTSELAVASSALHDRLEERVERLLALRVPEHDERRRRLAAGMLIQIVRGVLPAIVAADEPERTELTGELKAALVGYWTTLEAGGDTAD
jgi:AcrR family transcriptional regulator